VSPSRDDDSRGGGVALVLGAGGPIGFAFHAGVLRALAEGRGWDARDAALIVGTSAGAQTGALLRAGLSPHDLFAHVTGGAVSAAGHAIAGAVPWPRVFAAAEDAPLVWPASWSYLSRVLRRPWRARAGPLVAALLPEGARDTSALARMFGALFPRGWPERALWLPAVELDTGASVVFGRAGAPVVDVGTAVQCSSAVPGARRPIAVGGGGSGGGGVRGAPPAAAPAAAATAGGAARLRVAVISAPLSQFGALKVMLRFEARAVAAAGVRLDLFEPDAIVARTMGWNPMDPRACTRVAVAAYRATLAHLLRGSGLRGSGSARDGGHQRDRVTERTAQRPAAVDDERDRM
jgi:NTE family protein